MTSLRSDRDRFRGLGLLALALLAWCVPGKATAAEPAPAQPSVAGSVVKVSVHANFPDLLSPWQKAGMESSTGSGVIVEGQRILTNAHVVESSVSIEVKRSDSAESFPARVLFVGHDCDLALLTVDDPAFFAGARPLKIGEMPPTREQVQVFGFPVGGETLSVTSGILSRVEISTYAHAFEDLLLAQIDASINPGNSGGPVVARGSLVGIATQFLEDADNVGYMVPVPVIRHFLTDVTDGRYDGFPRLGVEIQPLESEALRASLKLAPGETGALVLGVDAGGPADGLLQVGDVLLAIDGADVANDATIQAAGLGRLHLSQRIHAKQIGEPVALTISRGGQRLEKQAVLIAHQQLVPGRRGSEEPQYLVFAGVVFQPLTLEYLLYFEEMPANLSYHSFYRNTTTPERQQIILIQKVLPHAVNRGYQDWEDAIVETVNGVKPRDMRHLAEIIDGAKGPWLRIVTDERFVMVLDLARARAAQAEILAGYGIARERSMDLMR